MPRMKLPRFYRRETGEASSSSARPPKRARGDYMARRKEIFDRRRIVPEKGLDMVALRQTFVPGAIAQLGFEEVASQQLPYNEAVVREFYTSCARDTFRETGRVLMQGREVLITPGRINAYYGIQVAPEDEGGVPVIPEVTDNPQLASALRVNGSPMWGSSGEILQRDLHFPAAFWNLFSSHSAQPTRHTSDLSIKRGRVVYCFMHGRRFDLGAIIHNEIAERSTGTKGILPFPGLITLFCREAGVFGDPQFNRPAASPIGHTSYNNVIHLREGIHKLSKYGDLLPIVAPAEVAAQVEEHQEGDEETEAADEFAQDLMFDIETDFPSQEAQEQAAPGPTEPAPSQQHPPPSSSTVPPAQASTPPEWAQQLITEIRDLKTQQQAIELRLARIEERVMNTSLTISTHQAQSHEHFRQLDSDLSNIFATGVAMTDRLRGIEQVATHFQGPYTHAHSGQSSRAGAERSYFNQEPSPWVRNFMQQFPPPEDFMAGYVPRDSDD